MFVSVVKDVTIEQYCDSLWIVFYTTIFFCFSLERILYLRIKIFNKDFRASVLQWGFLSNIFNIQLLRKTDLLPLIAILFNWYVWNYTACFLQHARRYNFYQMHFVYLNILKEMLQKMFVLMFVMYFWCLFPKRGDCKFRLCNLIYSKQYIYFHA